MAGDRLRRGAKSGTTRDAEALTIPTPPRARAHPCDIRPTVPRPGLEPPSLESLMIRAQGGDGEAFREVLRAALPLLREVATARLGNTPRVETAVQDALLTIHQLRQTYEPGRPVLRWVAAIAERRLAERLGDEERLSAPRLAIGGFWTLPLARLLARLRGRRNALL